METLRAELQSARGGEPTLKAEVSKLQSEVSRLQSDLAAVNVALEEKTVEAKAAEDAAQEDLRHRLAAQGATFRAVAERVIFTESFSRVTGKLASIAGGKIADRIFERFMMVVPELDRSILGYVPLPEKNFRQGYVRILLDALDSYEVLRTLSTQTELLSAELINELSTDLDADLEQILRRLNVGEEVSSKDEERGDEEEEEEDEEEYAQGEVGQTTTADVNSPPPTDEGPHQGGEI